MSECQQQKVQYAKSFIQVCCPSMTSKSTFQISRELEDLKVTVQERAPEPFDTSKTADDENEWDCVDISTQFYNALSVSGTFFIDMLMLKENLEINRVDVDSHAKFLKFYQNASSKI